MLPNITMHMLIAPHPESYGQGASDRFVVLARDRVHRDGVNMGHNGKQPIVQVEDVVKTFPIGDGEVTVLKGITFDVACGEFVSIVGPSGNGKSTLLNMVTGIDRPTRGQVVVGGNTVNKMSEDALAHWRGENLGIIFQFFQMLPGLSILNNVILPMDLAGKYKPKERRDRAM